MSSLQVVSRLISFALKCAKQPKMVQFKWGCQNRGRDFLSLPFNSLVDSLESAQAHTDCVWGKKIALRRHLE